MHTKNKVTLTLRILRDITGGDFQVTRYSPGDGWTRYGIFLIGSHEVANSLTASEVVRFMDGMIIMHQLVKLNFDLMARNEKTYMPKILDKAKLTIEHSKA